MAVHAFMTVVPVVAAAPFLAMAVAEDVRSRRLPRHLIRHAGIAAGLTILAVALLSSHPERAAGAVAGAAISFVLLGAMWMASPTGIGFGDVRLAAVTGLLVGWVDPALAPIALFVAFLLAAPIGMAMWLTRRAVSVPFGPFLVAGALAIAVHAAALG